MRRRHPILVLLLAFAIATSGCASAPTVPAPPAAPPVPTSAVAGATTVVAVAPPAQPCCPHPTLWEFLGVKALADGVGGAFNRIRNRLGSRFPGLEAKPPLLALTDPANMKADAPPAVKAAADAKAFEDQAAQKVKALRYLAKLGCTDCFPDIEKAILAALDDCSEIVRYEAVLAVRTLAGGPCAACKANSCCTPAIIKRLDQIANDTDDKGCYVEPSARVRRGARVAMAACGGSVSTDDLPTEGPDAVLPEGPPGEAPAPPPPPPVAGQPPAVEVARRPAASNAPAPAPVRYCPRCRTAHADNEPHRDNRVAPVDFQTALLEATSESSTTALAEVNGEPIYEHEVVAILQRRGQQDRSIAAVRAELSRCIETKLIVQDARRHGFEHLADATSLQQAAYQPTDGRSNDHHDESTIAAKWLDTHVRVPADISRQEVFNFYRSRLDHYQPPPEVRWERLTAPIGRFGSKRNAEAAINCLRDRAQGVSAPIPPGIELARVVTEDHDWTRKDQLPSAELGHWLFVLPVGTVSPVLYDADSAYIVRVVERRQGRAASLEQASAHIEQEIISQRRAVAQRNYVASLRRDARIWSLFDTGAPAHSASHP